MTEEEIEAKRVADEQALAEAMKQDELTQIKEKLAKAEEDRDNYRTVALKRLGKLPGDAEFLGNESKELSVAEQVKIALLDSEVEKVRASEKIEIERIRKENAELRLAIKNRPGSSIGGSSGGGAEVKDNVFSEQQIVTLRARATKLKIDPEKYIATAKANLARRS